MRLGGKGGQRKGRGGEGRGREGRGGEERREGVRKGKEEERLMGRKKQRAWGRGGEFQVPDQRPAQRLRRADRLSLIHIDQKNR
ncbi:hypothetical protein C6W10_36735 [Plantactinospora sp. BB1]|nr:hypothetical protein C6W10_36735 [Plantactinospora sp. BB1]